MLSKLHPFLCTLMILLWSCACASRRPVREPEFSIPSGGAVHSIIYIIHGDGNYLYHSLDGDAHQADEEALEQALKVAQNCPRSEVFIFHQKRRMRIFGIIALKDGELYHYRDSVLIERIAYSRKDGDSAFAVESGLYAAKMNRVSEWYEEHPPKRFFLYFGHHIPEYGGRGYHRSYPGRAFTVDDLARGIERFTSIDSGSGDKLDLIVLSTCYSGTPGVIVSLAPYSRYIIASPDNLHLSYLNVEMLQTMSAAGVTDVYHLAREAAQRAFEKLKQNTQTMITIALYDTAKVVPYLESIGEYYRGVIGRLRGSSKDPIVEFYDCLENPVFYREYAKIGIDIFYSPPRFGRQRDKSRHSGWECLRRAQ